MKSNLRVLDGNVPRPDAGLGFEGRILRLVKGRGPERQAMEAGEIDAIMDPATGNALLLPEAQAALRGDQARVRSLLALSADWCWEQDEFYRLVSHTGTASGSSGIFDASIIGKTFWDLPFVSMSEADWQAHRRQLQWRATFRDLELKCTDRAGEVLWVSISGEPTFDEQDRFTGYRGTMRDITLRKQTEALVRQPIRLGEGAARGVVPRNKTISESKRQERLPAIGHKKVAKGDPIANSLLAALPRKDYQRLLAGLEAVTLTYGEVLYEPGDPIRHVYFPNDSLVSLLTTVEDHEALEVGLVGREGMVGISLALGIDVASVRALVQGTGAAQRMKSARFHKEFRQSGPLQRELYRYTHAKLAQARQTAACNRFHVVAARLARWLLMTRDRVQSNDFRLTQELLSHMLGVQREGVSRAAGQLQKLKLIEYSRGNIRIVDRRGLEAASCSCYGIVRSVHS
ncbi:MAG TPA: helix-turn-helix domain-containing protein [Burkholderiales bacterium]|nr:helix-turn-helix domain-containing protein [Burkholderiales bacterium]